MATRIAGVDIGSHSIRVVIVETRGKDSYAVIECIEEPYVYEASSISPTSDTAEKNIATSLLDNHKEQSLLFQVQEKAFERLVQKNTFQADMYCAAIASTSVMFRTVDFPFDDRKKIQELLPYQLENDLSIDIHQKIYNWMFLPQTKMHDVLSMDAVGEKNKSTTQSNTVLVGIAQDAAVARVMQLFRHVDLEPRHIFCRPHVFEEWFRYDEIMLQENETIVVVDIGHESTEFSLVKRKEGVVYSSQMSSLLVGGKHISQALAKELNLTEHDAMWSKHQEAFIEVTASQARFPEQQHMSEILKYALRPIIVRLRQVLQSSIQQGHDRIEKMVLLGGGSKVMNIEAYLEEQLHMQVQRPDNLERVWKTRLPLSTSSGALAFALALAGLPYRRQEQRIDFRSGLYAYNGDYDFVRPRIGSLAVWAAVLLFLLMGGYVLKLWNLHEKDQSLASQKLQQCQKIVGESVNSFTQCLSMIQEKTVTTTGFQIPRYTAVDHYAEIARQVNESNIRETTIKEFDLTRDQIRLKGISPNSENMEALVSALQKGRCFSDVTKEKSQMKGETSIEWTVLIKIDCIAAPGIAAHIVNDDNAHVTPAKHIVKDSVHTVAAGVPSHDIHGDAALAEEKPAIPPEKRTDVSQKSSSSAKIKTPFAMQSQIFERARTKIQDERILSKSATTSILKQNQIMTRKERTPQNEDASQGE